MKDEWKERALRELVPGARVRIVTSPRGDFDDGVEIIIDSVDSADGWVCYHYPEDFVWNDPHSGESFPMGEMFGGGETGLEPFCDRNGFNGKWLGLPSRKGANNGNARSFRCRRVSQDAS